MRFADYPETVVHRLEMPRSATTRYLVDVLSNPLDSTQSDLMQKGLKPRLGAKRIECGLDGNLGHMKLPLFVSLLKRLQRFFFLSDSNVEDSQAVGGRVGFRRVIPSSREFK